MVQEEGRRRTGERSNIEFGSKYLVVGSKSFNLAIFLNLLRKVRLERKIIESQKPRVRKDPIPLPVGKAEALRSEKSCLFAFVQGARAGVPKCGQEASSPLTPLAFLLASLSHNTSPD